MERISTDKTLKGACDVIRDIARKIGIQPRVVICTICGCHYIIGETEPCEHLIEAHCLVGNNMNDIINNSPHFRKMLSYRFLSLPYNAKMLIVSEMHLLDDGDDGLRSFQMFDKVFERAKGKNVLGELMAAVEQAENEEYAKWR